MKTKSRQQLQDEVVEMIGRHKGRIIMICQAYTDSRADLEDCFQEVAARIWEGYANFRGDAAEATWIYRVTLNCAINFSRKSRQKPPTVALLDHDMIEEASSETDKNTERLYRLKTCSTRSKKP